MHILLTGADGNLGRVFRTHFAARGHTVVAVRRILHDGEGLALDVRDAGSCAALVASQTFDAVVHLAAVTSPDACEREPVAANAVNAEGTRNLVAAMARECVFVLASTDYVFDGTRPPYKETDPKAPLNVYGATKSRAEDLVRKMAGQFLILRLPVLYGLSERNDSGFLRGALVNVLGGQVIELDDDQVRYPTHFQDVAIGAEFLLREGHRGIFHLSSQEAATRYSFARTLARLLGVSGDHLIPGGQKRLDAVPRPHHCKLSTDRFLASGGPVPRPLSAVLPLLVEEIQPR